MTPDSAPSSIQPSLAQPWIVDLSDLYLPAAPSHSPSTPHPSQQLFNLEIYSPSRLPDLATASAVGPLFHKIYADRYVVPAFQDGKVYIDEVKESKSIPIIIKDQSNCVVGHFAILFVNPGVVELGRIVVDPSTRGHNLTRLMTKHALSELATLQTNGKVDVAYAETLTCHTITQKIFSELGWMPTGIFDRKYPDFLLAGDREGVLRLTTILNPQIQAAREVHLPEDYRQIAELVYSNSGCLRNINSSKAAAAKPASLQTIVVDEYELQAFQASTINSGSGITPSILSQIANNQFAKGADHTSIRIDIGCANAVNQINSLRLDEFYFAALEMQANGDFLVMQKLSGRHKGGCLPSVHKLMPQQSIEMLDLIRAEKST